MIDELRLCVPRDTWWEADCEKHLLPGAWYLLHTINYRRQGWHTDDDGFVALKCEYLRRLVGRSFSDIRTALVSLGVVEWDRQYFRGARSMRYRITPAHSQSKIVVCSDRPLLTRVRRVLESEDRRLLPVHRWLKSKLQTLQLNTDHAQSIVAGIFPSPDSPLNAHEYQSLLMDQIMVLAGQITSADVPLTRDDYGRVHTPLTRLPKLLRRCVASSEGRLIAIDLANSQPLFAGVVAAKYLITTKQSRWRLRRWTPPTKPYGSTGQPTPQGPRPRITMSATSQLQPPNRAYGDPSARPDDLVEYMRLCQRGRLYDDLQPPGIDRSDFKRRLFCDVFFGEDKHPSHVRQDFESRFPTLMGVVRELKSVNYQRFAWLMQHEESTLFIGRICRRLMQQCPTIPLYTVHDSLVTTENHLHRVRSVAQDEFAVLGVAPTFSVESWA